jgi:hypothetical protein
MDNLVVMEARQEEEGAHPRHHFHRHPPACLLVHLVAQCMEALRDLGLLDLAHLGLRAGRCWSVWRLRHSIGPDITPLEDTGGNAEGD